MTSTTEETHAEHIESGFIQGLHYVNRIDLNDDEHEIEVEHVDVARVHFVCPNTDGVRGSKYEFTYEQLDAVIGMLSKVKTEMAGDRAMRAALASGDLRSTEPADVAKWRTAERASQALREIEDNEASI
jgi:hypothetical protein